MMKPTSINDITKYCKRLTLTNKSEISLWLPSFAANTVTLGNKTLFNAVEKEVNSDFS